MPFSKRQLIVFGIIGAVVLIAGLAFLFGGKSTKDTATKKVKLVFWGVFDDVDVFRDLMTEYSDLHPGVTIDYRKKSIETYEKELAEAFSVGAGPDIFMVNNAWMPRYLNKIDPIDPNWKFMTVKEFKSLFSDVAYQDLVSGGGIYGLPLYIDTLALFWNSDIFNSAGLSSPPATWTEFKEDVKRLTKKDVFGNITRSGAALGTASNVNRSSDILALLMLQGGSTITDPDTGEPIFNKSISINNETYKPGETALEFYTDFANPKKEVYSWNSTLPYSLDAFTEGKTAMMFNYAYNIPILRAKNPHLNFEIAQMPQISEIDSKVNYANYFAAAVSNLSQNPEEAWQFILFLTEKKQQEIYLKKTDKPAGRRDLLKIQVDDPVMGPFAEQALSAKSWLQFDNMALEKTFGDMIEWVVRGEETPSSAISRAINKIRTLMQGG